MKKVLITIFAILFLCALVGGGFYLYSQYAKGGVSDITSTSSDGLATLSAIFYDFSGDPVTGGVIQALVGGTKKYTHVKFEMKASNTGNVGLTDVRVYLPNSNMNGAFDNVGTIPTLAVGQSNIILGNTAQTCVTDADCDSNEECQGTPSACYIALDQYSSGTSTNNVAFTISLQGDYRNAQGVIQSITSDPVTLTYDLREEKCTDTTPINTCVFNRTGVDADKSDYCQFTEGSLPSIIEKASVCGCPAGYTVNGDTCVGNTCADGTAVNTCSVDSHEGNYGAYYFCKPDGTFEARCIQCGCTDDYYGSPKDISQGINGCTSGTDPSSCVYQTYTGDLTGCIPDCIGKTTGQSDGCGGTCP